MKDNIKEYIYENIKLISVVTLCIVVGVIIGGIIFKYSNDEVKQSLIDIASQTIQNVKNDDFEEVNILLNGMKTNIPVICYVYFSALTYIPVLLISIFGVLKGISIGIYISIILSIFGFFKGLLLSVISVIIPNVIFVIAYIYSCSNSLNIHYKLKEESIKIYDVIKELLNIIIGFSVIFLSVLIEQIMVNIAINNII